MKTAVLLVLMLMIALPPAQAHEIEYAGSRFFIRVEESTWMNSSIPVSLGFYTRNFALSAGRLWSDKLASSGIRYTAEYQRPLTETFRPFIRVGTDRYRYLPQGGIDYSMGLEIRSSDHVAYRVGVENGWLYGNPRFQLCIRVGELR